MSLVRELQQKCSGGCKEQGFRSPEFDSQHYQKNFRGKIIDVAEVNQQRWLEESGQRLENVDETHQVLAISGKFWLVASQLYLKRIGHTIDYEVSTVIDDHRNGMLSPNLSRLVIYQSKLANMTSIVIGSKLGDIMVGQQE